MVGRAAEFAALLGALDDVEGGSPAMVLVAGEAGVGKSRLLAEFAAVARTRGALVALGGCVELREGGIPYGPFRELLRSILAQVPPAVFVERGGIEGALVASHLAGAPAPILAAAPPIPTDQARIYEAVLVLGGRLGRATPLLLAVEDLHLADPSSIDLLLYLIHGVTTERAMVVGTYRPEGLAPDHPLRTLVTAVRRSPRGEVLELAGLTREETRAQLATILGRRAGRRPRRRGLPALGRQPAVHRGARRDRAPREWGRPPRHAPRAAPRPSRQPLAGRAIGRAPRRGGGTRGLRPPAGRDVRPPGRRPRRGAPRGGGPRDPRAGPRLRWRRVRTPPCGARRDGAVGADAGGAAVATPSPRHGPCRRSAPCGGWPGDRRAGARPPLGRRRPSAPGVRGLARRRRRGGDGPRVRRRPAPPGAGARAVGRGPAVGAAGGHRPLATGQLRRPRRRAGRRPRDGRAPRAGSPSRRSTRPGRRRAGPPACSGSLRTSRPTGATKRRSRPVPPRSPRRRRLRRPSCGRASSPRSALSRCWWASSARPATSASRPSRLPWRSARARSKGGLATTSAWPSSRSATSNGGRRA